MNLTFTLCFTVECILKLISYGPGVIIYFVACSRLNTPQPASNGFFSDKFWTILKCALGNEMCPVLLEVSYMIFRFLYVYKYTCFFGVTLFFVQITSLYLRIFAHFLWHFLRGKMPIIFLHFSKFNFDVLSETFSEMFPNQNRCTSVYKTWIMGPIFLKIKNSAYLGAPEIN